MLRRRGSSSHCPERHHHLESAHPPPPASKSPPCRSTWLPYAVAICWCGTHPSDWVGSIGCGHPPTQRRPRRRSAAGLCFLPPLRKREAGLRGGVALRLSNFSLPSPSLSHVPRTRRPSPRRANSCNSGAHDRLPAKLCLQMPIPGNRGTPPRTRWTFPLQRQLWIPRQGSAATIELLGLYCWRVDFANPMTFRLANVPNNV